MEDDGEAWLFDTGCIVIETKALVGYASLSPLERLIYCVWVADCGMRKAGDLKAAADLHPPFLEDAKAAALEVGLPHTTAAFSFPSDKLEERYFSLFEAIVAEIRVA
ncbi:hypothetical protein [Ensifer canadensis]